MNKKERSKIRKYLRKISELATTRETMLQVNHINAIIDIDEDVHRYKSDLINKTRVSGNLNNLGVIIK